MLTIFYRGIRSHRRLTLMTVVPAIAIILLTSVYARTASSPAAPAAQQVAPTAAAVYGQADFTTGTLQPTGPGTLKNASSVASDLHGGIYVVDYGNSRVLHFPFVPGRTSGFMADRVYGQPDFWANRPNIGPGGLNYPHGIAVAPNGDLYVADMFNNRVLHYPATSTVAGQVYGQPDFISTTINTGGISAGSLYHPQGLAVNPSGLYVADSANNRVLHYPFGSTVADFVYGQGLPGNAPNNFAANQSGSGAMGLNNPRDVAVDANGIYVADTSNNRIVHYTLGNPVADFVYGQPDLNSTQVNQGQPQPTATTLNNPTKVTLDQASGLYVADRDNNRVLYYPPTTGQAQNGIAALRLYGQNSYTTLNSGTTATMFHGPGAVAVDNAGAVFVLDIFNQRVLKF